MELCSILHKIINSIIYLTYRHPIVITGWVIVRYGRLLHRNWGDDINVYLIERMTGKRVVVQNCSVYHRLFYRGPVYSCIGSVLDWYEASSKIVWGSGLINSEGCIPPPQNLFCKRSRNKKKAIGVGNSLSRTIW